jgi:hypothetical protein
MRFTWMLFRAHGVIPALDHIAHRVRLRGPIVRWLCDKSDAAFGVYDEA